MPKVAQYGEPQVRTQVVRQPRADAAAGNAVFRSNIQAAEGLASVAQTGAQMMQRIDTTSAEEALVAFEREKNNLFFNPESGYFNTQGKNAYENATAANEALQKLQQQYGEGLNQNARRMFDKASTVQITRSQADIARHSAKGLQSWEVATIRSQVENTVENASLYWNQPDQLAVQNAVGRQAVIDAAELEGIGPEATAERLQTYGSSFAKAAISTATSYSAAQGQELYDKMSDRLESPDKLKLEREIQAKVKAEKIQSDSQQAMITGAHLVDTYDSREDIRNEVNTIEDPELRSKTMTEAMRQFNLKKQAEDEAQAEAFKAAESHLYDGGSAETFQAENPEGWERLSAKQKKSLETGKPVVTDWNVYSDLMVLPKEELAKVNPADYISQLAPAERTKLISAVKSARGTGTASEKIDHQVGRTRSAQTTSALEQILGKKAKWNDEKRKQADAFYDLLDSEVQYREQQKGSLLSSQEYTDVLSDLTREVTIERSAFGVGFLAPDVELSLIDMSQADMRVLSEFLRDNNIPVTSENLIKAQRQATE